MSKQPTISKEAQVLLKLLRLSLGTEPMKYFGEPIKAFPEEIDWKEVIRLSYEHKVSALAVDGLKASNYNPYKGLDEMQSHSLKVQLVPWIDDVINTENSYIYYVNVLTTLCQIYADNGLKTIILKGYGLSLNYAIPSHRGVGDIDIFIIDEEGKQAARRGDRIMEEMMGLEVIKLNHEHHSHFVFKGIDIENHYELRSPFRNNINDMLFVDELRKQLEVKSEYEMYNNDILLPTPTFNALLLIRHMFGDLRRGALIIRELCDWVTFKSNHYNDVDWNYVQSQVSKAGLLPFYHLLDEICYEYLGQVNCFQERKYRHSDINGFIKCVISPCKMGQSYFSKIQYYYKNRWNIKFTTGNNWLACLIRNAFTNCVVTLF